MAHSHPKAARCSIPHLYGPTLTPQGQSVTSGLAFLQVAAYGGKLRYTLSYTAGPQGSPLSDPDVQITGNNIMLVASQPALQGTERRSYEIVLREVRGT